MGSGIRDKYNVAINGKGYILNGVPGSPGYSRAVIASQIDRLSISDIAYSDFASTGIFFSTQTDWSGGIKKERLWKDDAKFYYSTNIDAYSAQGTLKLEKEVVLSNDFNYDLVVGGTHVIGGTTYECVITKKNAAVPRVYLNSGAGWSEVAGSVFGNSNQNSDEIEHKGNLWIAASGSNTTAERIQYYTGSAWTNVSAAANTAFSGTVSEANCFEQDGPTLYVAVNDGTYASILSTVDNGANFIEELALTTSGQIVSMRLFMGKLYYLLRKGSIVFFRVFDPSDNSDASIPAGTFYNISINSYGMRDLLKVFQGSLIITMPISNGTGSIYAFDGTNLSIIYQQDPVKTAIGENAWGYLANGATDHDNKLYWGNLIYDGTAFFNFKKTVGDGTDLLIPLYVSSADVLRYIDTADKSKLLVDASTYKGTIGSNFLVMSEMSPVTKIDKLLVGVGLFFKEFAASEYIRIDYSIDNQKTWVTLTTLGPSTTGDRKDIYISTSSTSAVLFNKIWFRVHMSGSATSPELYDLILMYKPIPDYKNRWILRLKMSDDFKLLNNQIEQRRANDLLEEFWTMKQLKKSVLFEDLDYRECSLVSAMTSSSTSALVDSTKRFPRNGRIRVVSAGIAEEMIYTSTTPKKLLGISRAQRGTQARSHAANQIIKNDYNVYIDDVNTHITFTDKEKSEGVIQVSLFEV